MRRYKSVTNVNITHIHVHGSAGFGDGRWKGRKRKDRKGGKGRKPRLLGFFATGGILDRDVAARMGTGEFWDEGTRLISHGARGIRSNLAGMGWGGKRIAKGFAGIARALFGESGR